MSSDSDSTGEAFPTLEEIKRWRKASMEAWLTKRGLRKSGKTKEILANRILRHMEGDASLSSSESDVEVSNATEDLAAPTFKKGEWEDLTQPEQIPNIRQEDVTNYYLHGKNPVTGGHKNLNRYLEKARRYSLEEGYIGNLGFQETETYQTFHSLVRPSMKPGVYDVVVHLYRDTGMVHSGQCQCKVGATGYCAHIGGVLLRLVRLRNPCTSKLCGWNVPTLSKTTKVQPQPLSEMNWWPGKPNPKKPWTGYKAGPCASNESHNSNFREEILDGLATANPDCVLYVTERKSITNIDRFLELFETPCRIADGVDLRKDWVRDFFLDFVEELEVSAELSSEVERATRGQNCNPYWLKARNYLLTASNFGSVCKMRESTQPDATLRRLCGYQPTPTTVAMQYGIKSEPRGRKLYLKQHQKNCTPTGNKMAALTSVGLVVSTQWPFLGASLDGLISCPVCGTGGLEIKSPYKFRHFKVADMCGETGVCCELDEVGTPVLKEGHKYWYQVQGQMAVTGLKWVDFVIYTQKDLTAQRIHFNDAAWNGDILPCLRTFYTDCMVPEFFTKRVERKLPLYPAQQAGADKAGHGV